MIIPVILVLLLALVLVLDAVYFEDVNKITHEAHDSILEGTRLHFYNASLNGTEPSIERQLILSEGDTRTKLGDINYILLPMGLSYTSEYAMNTFGTNFCGPYFYERTLQKECVATKLDLILTAGMFHTMSCANQFYEAATNASLYPGIIFTTNDTVRIRDFVLSERGENIFDGCTYSTDALLSSENLKTISGSVSNVPFEEKIDDITIRIITPLDIVFFIVLLLVIGYVFSSVVLWAHRKNPLLKGAGKKSYVVMTILFFVFVYLIIISPFVYISQYILAVTLLLAYIATSLIWGHFSKNKEKRPLKR